MFQFNEEEFFNILKEVYERGYYGYLDLCPLVVDEYLEKHRKPDYQFTPIDTVPDNFVVSGTILPPDQHLTITGTSTITQ